MIPYLNVAVAEENNITITDLTKESKEYLPEESVIPQYERFKYSETVTVNIIELLSVSGTEHIATLYSEHCVLLDEVHYKLPKDGHYRITHIILPNLQWLEKLTNLEYYSRVYVSDGEKVMKVVDDHLEEINYMELLGNCNRTTLAITSIELFFMYNLNKCFVDISKTLLKSSLSKCNVKDNDLTFKKDFIWMSINVLKYYIELDKLTEAQRLLEEINYCNGFCSSTTTSKKSCNCGCSKI